VSTIICAVQRSKETVAFMTYGSIVRGLFEVVESPVTSLHVEISDYPSTSGIQQLIEIIRNQGVQSILLHHVICQLCVGLCWGQHPLLADFGTPETSLSSSSRRWEERRSTMPSLVQLLRGYASKIP